MEKEISEKLETLLKYIPFIDFVLKTDSQKYVKFIDIRKWITIKKRYPLSDLNKIEQSIITQYKNLLLVDHKIPMEIMQIFNNEIKHQFVNLCSDDEDENTAPPKHKSIKEDNHKLSNRIEDKLRKEDNNKLSNRIEDKLRKEDNRKLSNRIEENIKTIKEDDRKTEVNQKKDKKAAKKSSSSSSDKKKDKEKKHKKLSSSKKKHHTTIQISTNGGGDSEDDLEIVSVINLDKPKAIDQQHDQSKNQESTTVTKSCDKSLPNHIISLDEISEQLLRKIDDFDNDNNKKTSNFPEPINYHKHSDDDDDGEGITEVIPQDLLYQRRKSDDALFKRRDDFKDPTHEKQPVKAKSPENKENKHPTIVLETISLDSSDSEDSNEPSTSAKALAKLKRLKLTVSDQLDTPSPGTASATNIACEDLNRKSNVVVVANNLNCNNGTNTQTETLNKDTDLVRTSNHDVPLPNDATTNRHIDGHSNIINLIDMDVDIENDLNDVLKEIINPEDLNPKTPDICDNLSMFRNSTPQLPTETVTAAAAEEFVDKIICNKENSLTTSCDDLATAFDAKNLGNLSQEQIYKIFEYIENQSDFEIDKLLETLPQIVHNNNTPPTWEQTNTSPVTPLRTAVTNIQNDLTPPAPHFIPNTPSPQQQQHSVAQPQLQQQPIFYPNPQTPAYVITPPQHIYQQHPNQHYLQQQQQQQQYNVLSGIESSFSRINLKDPRIIRKLQMIKDSPLWNEFNQRNAEMLTNAVCRKQQQQQQQQQPHMAIPTYQMPQQQQQQPYHLQPITNIPTSFAGRPAARRKSTTKSAINFGEYKRRQLEQQQELERKREEEKKRKEEALKAKQSEEIVEIEHREHLKCTGEIRSILLSTLEPYRDEIETLLGQQCNSSSSTTTTTTTQQTKSDDVTISHAPSKQTELTHRNETNKSHCQNEPTIPDKSNGKINRVFKELECTMKGYDRLPKAIGGKRRSSLHARSSIAEQLNSYQSDVCLDPSETMANSIGCKRRSSVHQTIDISDTSLTTTSSTIVENAAGVTKDIGAKRRSSINARLAIVEQLSVLQDSIDCSDSSEANLSESQSSREMPKLITTKRRASTLARSAISEQLHQQPPTDYSDSSDITIDTSQSTTNGSQNSGAATKRRRTIDEPIQTKRRNRSFILRDDSTSSSDEEAFERDRLAKLQRLKEDIIKNQPTVVLERISQDFIRKHTRRRAPVLSSTQNVLNVHLVESTIRPAKIDVIEKPPAQKLVKPKRFNNDCQMTERNIKFCALCTTKPANLTLHYKRKHKSESYVSRLTWPQLEELCLNTPFAKLQQSSFNSRTHRYLVDCPFCDQHLVESFTSLYDHYSTHTGEYAYQCAHCQMEKPYKADIHSHQLNSKTCRNNSIKVLYRYPPNVQCIYLHYCTICNFVQLNEANIYKHLREHHDPRKAQPQNVQKCILAAISDGPDMADNQIAVDQENPNIKQDPIVAASSTAIKKTENDFKVDDDYIPVSNEAFAQDSTFEEGKFSLEEQLKKMHEEPLAKITPMTVIHCDSFMANIKQTITPERQKARHQTKPITPHPGTNSNNTLQRSQPPVTLKFEAMDVDENLLVTPPRPSAIKLKDLQNNNNNSTSFTASNTSSNINQATAGANFSIAYLMDNLTHKSSVLKSCPVYEKYHNYPENVNYLGLYKCMTDDCYYSTDSSDEMAKHLDGHSQDTAPSEYLQCPYCIIPANVQIETLQLIEHIRAQHQHMIYQCSVCCYRSCEASNVLVHQRHAHVTASNAKVYKCSGIEINFNEKESYINDKIKQNVQKISCPYCSNVSFYNNNQIVQHLIQNHKIRSIDSKVYSCIYCRFADGDQNIVRKHLSTKHPEELPYIYDHNNTVEMGKADSLGNSLNILSVSQPVACLDANAVRRGDSGEEERTEDVKPELDDLIKMNEDTIKVRLRKLTAHTGTAPDSLYRCPEPSCGGFFSIFDLWLRHMRMRHHCLECQCPHCPSKHCPRPLESYADHFEEHRRHTYICFYCSTTSPNEILAKQHAVEHHGNLAEMRLEQIRFNVNYCYFVTIQTGLFTERVEFISEFLAVLDKRLLDMETIAVQSLKHQWLIPPNTMWLENVPNINNRRSFKKCLDATCKFVSVDEDVLLQHMNTNHDSYRSHFKCRKCHHDIQCNNWNDIFDHRKLHSDNSVFICVACLKTSTNRSKLADHIKHHHAARDVPVIEHIRTQQNTSFIKLAVVFANNHLTFSTIRNCFCCDEMNMNGDAFNLHLRRYHKLTLNYFCECCINMQFKSLEDVKSHFEFFHQTNPIKIRCELALNGELIVTSLDMFQLQIPNDDQKVAMMEVKKEPNDQPDYDSNDDDVIILEKDDLAIQESLKSHELHGEGKKPQLKCVSLNNLLRAESIQTPSSSSSNHSVIQFLRDKGIGQTRTATSSLNCFQNDSKIDNRQQLFPSTAYTHLNNGIPIVNKNQNCQPSSTAAAAPNYKNNMGFIASNTHNTTSTLNSHTSVQTAGSARNLTNPYTANNQNLANVSSQNSVLPNKVITINFDGGMSTVTNKNLPSSSSAALINYNNRSHNNMGSHNSTSSLRSQTAGSAQNLPISSYTTNNQNFSNLPTVSSTQNKTNKNNQNFANASSQNSVTIINLDGGKSTVQKQNLPSSSSAAALINYNNRSHNHMGSHNSTSSLSSHTKVQTVGSTQNRTTTSYPTNNQNICNVPTVSGAQNLATTNNQNQNQNYTNYNSQNYLVGNQINVSLCYNGQSMFRPVIGVDKVNFYHTNDPVIGMPMRNHDSSIPGSKTYNIPLDSKVMQTSASMLQNDKQSK